METYGTITGEWVDLSGEGYQALICPFTRSALLQIVNETLPALAALRDAGLVRHIGITGLPLKIYRSVLDRAPPGAVDVTLSYCHYCLNDRTLADFIPYLETKGVGVINASCLSMGLLTQGGPPPWHPAPAHVQQACAAAAKIAAADGFDLARLALMWAFKVRACTIGCAVHSASRFHVASRCLSYSCARAGCMISSAHR